MKFRIPCREANHICDKSQYKEASFLEKLKLQLHLIYCRACRGYSARNQKLTKVIQNANIKALSQADKKRIQDHLHQELKK